MQMECIQRDIKLHYEDACRNVTEASHVVYLRERHS